MLNSWQGIGRLVKEIELKKANNGTEIVNFTLAIQRGYDKEQADFINCVTFKHGAKFLNEYAKKGDLILVEGSINTSNYTNESGSTVYITQVNARSVKILGNRSHEDSEKNVVEESTESPKEEKKVVRKTKTTAEKIEEELPF